jgi:hypothetical protein
MYTFILLINKLIPEQYTSSQLSFLMPPAKGELIQVLKPGALDHLDSDERHPS